MKNIVLILLTLLLLSCTKNHSITSSCTITPSNTYMLFKIPNNLSQPFTYSMLRYDSITQEYLLYMKNMDRLIAVYLLKSQELKHIYNFAKDGPNAILNLSGFFYDENNIFHVMSGRIPMIYQVDSSGNVYDKFKYGLTSDNKRVLPSYSNTGFEVISNDGKLYLPLFDTDYIDGIKPYLIIDKTTNQIKYSDIDFIQTTSTGESLGNKSYWWCYNDQELIFAYEFDDRLAIHTPESSEYKFVTAKSQYIDELRQVIPENKDLYQKPERIRNNACYGPIIYDRYRKVYYRIAYLNSDCTPAEDWLGYSKCGRGNFSIMVLDKDFNLIGESLFPDCAKYSVNGIFVAPDGLYVNRSHCYDPEFSDDLLRFERFDLVYD